MLRINTPNLYSTTYSYLFTSHERGRMASFAYHRKMNITHEHNAYKLKWMNAGSARYNGAYYYSQEIVKNIIPNVVTDRSWITVNVSGVGCDHSIVFIHNNKHPDRYEWLKRYKDIILVCGVPDTVEKVQHIGKAIYLPLSIDVEYVKQFRTEKTKDTAYIGRQSKRRNIKLPEGIDYIENIERPLLLKQMAQYDTVYAVGRTAIEAKVLKCKLKAYDERYPKVSLWKPLDNHKAAEMLQDMLNEIDG